MKKILFTIIFLMSAICYAIPHQFESTATFETCFTPGNQCTDDIVDLLNSAKKQILMQAYYLTDDDIVISLITAKRMGLDVRVILDKTQANSLYANMLWQAGIDVRIDYLPHIAHNKTVIIDGKKVLTGSFNFTHAAQFKNAENFIIINDSNVSKEYAENFFNRFKASKLINSYQEYKNKK